MAPREIRLPQRANRHKSGEQLSQQQPDTSGTEYKPGGHTIACAHGKTARKIENLTYKKQILQFLGDVTEDLFNTKVVNAQSGSVMSP